MGFFRKVFFITALLNLLFLLGAQDAYVPGREWRIIRAQTADVIFPRDLEKEAQKGANLLDTALPELAETLGAEKLRRWTLVLNSDNLYSNGYVTLAPRYSLWYQGTGQERMIQGDWFSLLAAHEGRHMVQFDRLTQDLGALLYFLLGDQGTAFLLNAGLPRWVLEGDAVLSETLNTPFGRGRDPEFSREMKAFALDDQDSFFRSPYRRLVNGSYRTDLPDMYQYGYFLITYIRNHYGPDALDRMITRAASFPIPPLGMFLAAREVTGRGMAALFRDMLAELEEIYGESLSGLILTPAGYLDAPEKNQVFTFSRPGFLSSGAVAAVLASRDDRNRLFVYSADGRVLADFPFPHSVSAPLSIGQDQVLVTAAGQDPRWPALASGDFFLMDLETGRQSRLTRGGRYLSPALAPDGKKAAALYFAMGEEPEVQILDTRDGSVSASFVPPPGTLPGGLSWDTSQSRLVMTLNSGEGRALAVLDLPSGEFAILTPFGPETYKDPVFWGDFILFSSGYTGTENIHSLDRLTGRFYQVTSRPLGASRPSAGGPVPSVDGTGQLFFIDYTGSGGDALAVMPLDPSLWVPREKAQVRRLNYFEEILKTESLYQNREFPLLAPGNVSEVTYPVEPWSPGKGLLNIHSWGPDFPALIEDPARLRLGIQSRDILDTLSFSLAGSWNLNEKAPGVEVSLDIKGFYPVFSFTGLYRQRNLSGFSWQEAGGTGWISLPLNFSRGLHSRFLELGAGGSLYAYGGHPSLDRSGYLGGRLFYADYIFGGLRRITPLWGAAAAVNLAQNPQDPDDFVYSGLVLGFLPGLFRNQGLALEGGYEIRRGSRASGILFSRGYEAVEGETTLKVSADYNFPLAYPDLSLGGFFYLKRLKANLFGDFLRLDQQDFISAGAGLSADFTILDLGMAEAGGGFLAAYRFRDQRLVFQLILLDVAF